MVVGDVAFAAQPHHPEGDRHRAGPRGPHHAHEQELGMEPDAVQKEWCKRCQDQYDGVWQGWHTMSSVDRMKFGRDHLLYGTSHPQPPPNGQSRVLAGY
jgi:hypothetical protein